MSIFTVCKKGGETPLHALERLRMEKGIAKDIPMTYAGRLDPLAEGVLVILSGEDCKKKEDFTQLSKEYEVEILFGVSSDTFDPLGIVVLGSHIEITKEKIQEYMKKTLGTFIQTYPAYSSKTVEGESLFSRARKGTLPDTLPTREVTLFTSELTDFKKCTFKEVYARAESLISSVEGDFRQEEVRDSWKVLYQALSEKSLQSACMTLSVSSGFYVRAYAEEMGKYCGTGALALSIKRTKVGDYTC